jgi:hypothetical protein
MKVCCELHHKSTQVKTACVAVPEDLCPQLNCKAILSQDTVQQFPDSKRILVRRTFTPDGGLGDGTSPGPTLVGTEALQCPGRCLTRPNLVLAVTGTCFCTCNTQNVETLSATYQLIRRVTAVKRFPWTVRCAGSAWHWKARGCVNTCSRILQEG